MVMFLWMQFHIVSVMLKGASAFFVKCEKKNLKRAKFSKHSFFVYYEFLFKNWCPILEKEIIGSVCLFEK